MGVYDFSLLSKATCQVGLAFIPQLCIYKDSHCWAREIPKCLYYYQPRGRLYKS